MTESDIVFEDGDIWVCRDKPARQYVVYRVGVTHSKSDSAYALSEDGLSIALARARYLVRVARSADI